MSISYLLLIWPERDILFNYFFVIVSIDHMPPLSWPVGGAKYTIVCPGALFYINLALETVSTFFTKKYVKVLGDYY